MGKPWVTIITPTTGKKSLSKLIESIDSQIDIPWVHILLWDNKREDDYLYPNSETLNAKKPMDLDCSEGGSRFSIVIPDDFVKGKAYGSALRSVGLMIANTPYVTFADDDVWYEDDHLNSMIQALTESKRDWAYCIRKIWSNDGTLIGEDYFESVGDSPSRKVPYEMVDNNSMMFARRFGSSAACLYRETDQYNDDRLMYNFLKQYAGPPAKTEKSTVNQVCPLRLETFFKHNIG